MILVLRHLEHGPEVFVEPLGKLHHGFVQSLDPRLQSGGRFDRRQQLGMMLDVVLRARELALGRRMGRIQLAQDGRQVVVDQERQAQLVRAAVDAASLIRVLLQLIKVRAEGLLRDVDLLLQFGDLLRRAGTRRTQRSSRPHQVRRCPNFAHLIEERQIAQMEGVQAEDRRAHQDEHHSDDDAQADEQLEANWPSEHDDLHVVGESQVGLACPTVPCWGVNITKLAN